MTILNIYINIYMYILFVQDHEPPQNYSEALKHTFPSRLSWPATCPVAMVIRSGWTARLKHKLYIMLDLNFLPWLNFNNWQGIIKSFIPLCQVILHTIHSMFHFWLFFLKWLTIWHHQCGPGSVSASAPPRCTESPLQLWSTPSLLWAAGTDCTVHHAHGNHN